MSEEIRGFSIPFRIGPGGGVAQESEAEKLKENIIHILLTGVGERVMRRDYGGGIRQLVHDPNNDALRALVQHQIGKSIGQWEPRVLLQSVTVTQQDSTLIAHVDYIVRRTREPQSVSVPLNLGGV
jgi:phage baseplate assembly protein W